MGSGFVPRCLIPPGSVVSASSGWTQIFEVRGLGLVQTHLPYYRLEFRHGFWSLGFLGRLRRGLVGVSTSNLGKVPGGFITTRVATLWFSFTSGVGIAPFLFIWGVTHLWWFRTGGCSTTAGLTHRAALLEDFWWWRVDSGEWVSKRVLGRSLRRAFLRLRRWCRCWARGGQDHLETLLKGGSGSFRRWWWHHPVGGLVQDFLDQLPTLLLDLLLDLPLHL